MTSLEIEDRVYRTSNSRARITLKDHKCDFRNNPKTRLINPCKPNIGKVAKSKLSKIIREVKEKTHLVQWKTLLMSLSGLMISKTRKVAHL